MSRVIAEDAHRLKQEAASEHGARWLGGCFSRFPVTRRTGFQSPPGTEKDYSENNTEETV